MQTPSAFGILSRSVAESAQKNRELLTKMDLMEHKLEVTQAALLQGALHAPHVKTINSLVGLLISSYYFISLQSGSNSIAISGSDIDSLGAAASSSSVASCKNNKLARPVGLLPSPCHLISGGRSGGSVAFSVFSVAINGGGNDSRGAAASSTSVASCNQE